jgi:predicted component of type VI protein secretion system
MRHDSLHHVVDFKFSRLRFQLLQKEDERSLKLQLPVAVLSARKSERMLNLRLVLVAPWIVTQ